MDCFRTWRSAKLIAYLLSRNALTSAMALCRSPEQNFRIKQFSAICVSSFLIQLVTQLGRHFLFKRIGQVATGFGHIDLLHQAGW